MNPMQWLSGKKTYLGSLALSLLGAVWSLDLVIHGASSPHWFTDPQYIAVGTFVTGLTGAAMRLAIGKQDQNGGN